ncbi:hypothetical protein QBA74_27350 [Streptomyces scabiei]|uniref:hypothetical protein n=1 Tax=Streptomyces scabiei TaxID=1930 RepID=UPI002FF36E6F
MSAVTAGPAAAATIGSPAGIVVHSALKRVFIGDDATDSIIAADYNGNRVDSVRGIDGVFDLALSDDGATLYAAARGSHEIVALDAATLDVKARYPVAASIRPAVPGVHQPEGLVHLRGPVRRLRQPGRGRPGGDPGRRKRGGGTQTAPARQSRDQRRRTDRQ